MKLHWFGLQLPGLSGKFVDHQIGFEVGGAERLQGVVYHQKALVLLGEVIKRERTLLFALCGGVGQAVTVTAMTVACTGNRHAQNIGIRTFVVGREIWGCQWVCCIVRVYQVGFALHDIVYKQFHPATAGIHFFNGEYGGEVLRVLAFVGRTIAQLSRIKGVGKAGCA